MGLWGSTLALMGRGASPQGPCGQEESPGRGRVLAAWESWPRDSPGRPRLLYPYINRKGGARERDTPSFQLDLSPLSPPLLLFSRARRSPARENIHHSHHAVVLPGSRLPLPLACWIEEGGDNVKLNVWIPRRCCPFGTEIDLIESSTTPTTISWS